MDIPKTAGHGAVPVTVAYRAVFNDPLPLHPGSSEDPTYGVNGAITTQGTFLAASAGWYPAPLSTPQQRSVRIAAPAGIEAVSAGRRLSRWTEGSSLALFLGRAAADRRAHPVRRSLPDRGETRGRGGSVHVLLPG